MIYFHLENEISEVIIKNINPEVDNKKIIES